MSYSIFRLSYAIYSHFITVLFILYNLTRSIATEVLKLGKAALTAPLYISVAWSLIISYQLFTQTAVYSALSFLNILVPAAGGMLLSRIEMIVFIHAFAWIFVLSSVIPSVILGKGRSVLLQFFICLTLTLVAVSIEDVWILLVGTTADQQVQTLSSWFQNPLIAGIYLSAPYVLMLYIDIRSRKSRQDTETTESDDQESNAIEEQVVYEEQEIVSNQQNISNSEKNSEASQNMVTGLNIKGRSEKTRYLYGAGILCFLFALLTLWLDRLIFSVGLNSMSKAIYVVLLTGFGSILIFLGYYTTGNIKQPMPQ